MLSTLEMTFDLEADTKAIILKKKNNPKSGEELKVYVPRVMRGIDKGEPKIKISPIQYRGAFANSSECKPKISSMLREQNYLVGIYQNNANAKPVLKVVYNEDDDIEKTYIPEEEEVRCQFLNGKLGQLRLNTDDNLTYQANEFIYDEYVLKSDYGEDWDGSDDDIIERVPYTDDTKEKAKSKNGTITKIIGNTKVTVERNPPMGSMIL